MKQTKWILSITLLCFFCSNVVAQNYSKVIDKQLNDLTVQDKLVSQDANWIISSNHTSAISGVEHVYYSQKFNGLEIYGTASGVHYLPNGQVISKNNSFIKNVAQKVSGSASPGLTPEQAIRSAATQLGYKIVKPITVLENIKGNKKEFVLSDGGISSLPIPAKLMYAVTEDNSVVLAWDISIKNIEPESGEWWSLKVDAATGTIINKVNWILNCSTGHDHDHNEDVKTPNFNDNLYDIPNYKETVAIKPAACTTCYEVFELPLESPYYGDRTIVTSPANPTASPFGWHDTNGAPGAEFTVTKGNNVNAFDYITNFQPDGGADLDFSGYPFSQTYTNANQYESASITNLFYLNNVYHDIMHFYGFDAAAGNFQENNYGSGGNGSDSVNAQAQMGLVCNAFFGTPADGGNPTMQMYVCGDKDGDFDALVVFHEYSHGTSTRLTGGALNVNVLLNNEQMGEGWGDFYGALFTIKAGDTGATKRGVGTYLFGQGIDGDGIRAFPYSTDMTINPQTYNSIKNTIGPHAVGAVWAGMLWEVAWGLIDVHGYNDNPYEFTGDIAQDKGNTMAVAIITEGLKLQPGSPGFVDGRDAILAADQAIYGGANECIIWEAFAKRGLGYSASQGSSNNRNDGTEAFDLPAPDITCPADIIVEVNQGEQYALLDYTADATVTNRCTTSIGVTQNPIAGTLVDVGDTIITLTTTDDQGNENSCTFIVTVDELLGVDTNDFYNSIALYPNPTTGEITLANKTAIQLKNAIITDINGRTIKTINLDKAGVETNFSLNNLAAGMYFIKINTENTSIVKRIVKL